MVVLHRQRHHGKRPPVRLSTHIFSSSHAGGTDQNLAVKMVDYSTLPRALCGKRSHKRTVLFRRKAQQGWFGQSRVGLKSLTCLVRSFFFSSRRRHTRSLRDWSSDVCSSD